MYYSLLYDAPKLLPASGLEHRGADCVFGMKEVVLLRIGKKLPKTC